MPTRGISVGTTPTRIAAYNPARTALSFFNGGAANIFFSEDQTNIVTQGFTLPVGAAIDLVRPPAGMDEPEVAWFAQVAAGSEDLRVLEQYAKLPEGSSHR